MFNGALVGKEQLLLERLFARSDTCLPKASLTVPFTELQSIQMETRIRSNIACGEQ
ncbi:hypothetical protein MFUM_800016 [Methylacidiphilum fumariolicum SolV]|uniref:Uncharacterized protein n=2 Tax=Candidatus Methylacidiphilum fumarolicum TaxID=591154 RepID=I0JZY2_METFB|nr:conserved protein of unknown function [Candidatus Methylacidiphilum fumarolicum]CCG92801.1 hypothetical protein MFUM_800016 [Methylacidiphilum fumariolicum SolV]